MKTLSTAGNPGPAGATLRHSRDTESAAPSLDRRAPVADPFITDHEAGSNYPGGIRREQLQPALVINPSASALTLIRAIESRASMVRNTLQAWARTPFDGVVEVSPAEAVSSIEPVAEEVLILIRALASLVLSGQRLDAETEGGAA